MNWNGKKVLVTGAGGFIASHLVERLVSEEAQVRVFVRYNSRNDVGMLRLIPADVFSQLEVKYGDLRDVEAVRNAVKSMDTVFHLGALIAIPYSYVNPREGGALATIACYQRDVKIDLGVLDVDSDN